MSQSSRTRVAVVGAGFIADFHLEILRATPGVELVAVCDRVKHRAESAARRFAVARAVTSIGELAELGVRVCHLAVPPDLHGDVARECLAAGLGVFCEKPLVLSSAEARELAVIAQAKGLPLGVNHNSLFHPAFVELCTRVEAGTIGKVEHVRATLSVPLRQLDLGDVSHWMFHEPRNIVFEQAVHPLAQVHALLGRVGRLQTTLLGTRELAPGLPFHDRWLIAAQAERGTAEIHLSFGRSFTRHTLEVLASDGSFEIDLFHDTRAFETKTPWLDFWNSFLAGWRRGGALRRSAERVLLHYLRHTLGLGLRQDAFFAGMRASIRAFHAALAEGRPLPADGEAAAQVLEWCEAAVRDVAPARTRTPLPEPGPARPGEVVVLGGTGFIGRRTVARLLERELPVTVLVRRTHNLPQVLEDGARDGRIRLLRASLDDAESLVRGVSGASVVLQLATGGGARWEDFERAMVGGTRAVASACREAGARLVFVSSTAALYLGADCGYAIAEDDVAPDPEPSKRSLYARGKIAAELALEEMARETDLRVVIARPGIVLGPDAPLQHSGIGLWVRDNHCVGWGPGEHPLPLVLADDVADALAAMAAYRGDELDGQSLNLCARVPLSAHKLVLAMRERTGRDLHFHPRSLRASQVMELGKWIVKRVGGRNDAPFPSFRDLKSRALVPPFSSRTARELLGWNPVEDPDLFLARALGLPAPELEDEPDAEPLETQRPWSATPRPRSAAGGR